MRLFFAVPLPPEVRAELASARFSDPAYRWVAPELLHLTLLFLGEQEDGCVPDLVRASERVASTHKPPLLRLGKAGLFGSRRAPRVLWVGVDGEIDRLRLIQEELAASVAALVPLPDTREFTPHLTLARRRSREPDRRQPAVPWPPLRPIEPLPLSIDCFLLLKSTLLPAGPLYTPLARFAFGSPPRHEATAQEARTLP